MVRNILVFMSTSNFNRNRHIDRFGSEAFPIVASLIMQLSREGIRSGARTARHLELRQDLEAAGENRYGLFGKWKLGRFGFWKGDVLAFERASVPCEPQGNQILVRRLIAVHVESLVYQNRQRDLGGPAGFRANG